MELSKHIQIRQEQRSISDLIVKLILDGGDIVEEQTGGSQVIQLSNKEIKRIRKRIKKLAREWDHKSSVAVVECRDSLITTYHQC